MLIKKKVAKKGQVKYQRQTDSDKSIQKLQHKEAKLGTNDLTDLAETALIRACKLCPSPISLNWGYEGYGIRQNYRKKKG